MSDYTIYHNPRCRKSRETLAIMEASGVTPDVVLYLEEPPDSMELAEICEILGVRPHGIVRKKEAIELGIDIESLNEEEMLTEMEENPSIIERPIVVKDGHEAILGRPPANVRELI